MSIEDREWYRQDYEKRRKSIEANEKEELRRKRQIGADAMWNEVEPSKNNTDTEKKDDSHPKRAQVDRKRVLSILKRVPGYKKILSDCVIQDRESRVYFDFILIHEAGLFAFQICDDYRVLQAESTAKYWMVEDYANRGFTRYQERPTVQLEKDHGILDQAIRRYTHVKSFAYLIFPDSGGMENIVGVRNQMTTVRSLAAVLKSDIQEYGHAYNRNEIDQLYAIINDCLPSPTPGSISVGYSSIQKNKKQGSPIWMRFAQALGAIAVLAVVVLVVANTEWGSSFLKGKNIHFPSVHLPFVTEKEAKPTEIARSNPTSNTALIPSYLVYDGSAQEEYDHFAEEYGMTSVMKEADGSLTMSSEKNLIHANADALVATLAKKCGQAGYDQFISVTVNEDYTVFEIVVNDVKMSDEEKQAVTDLFLMAGLQAVQTEQAVQNIRVERVNMLGGVISREDTNPNAKAAESAKPADPIPKSTAAEKSVSSSTMLKESSYEGTCPFSVVLPNGDKDYYIYLKYIQPSSKSVKDRNKISDGNVDDVSMYIKAHDNFSCQVPVGVYQIYYTLGYNWYGTDERFGTGAPVYKSEDLLEFYNDGNKWYGHTIELRAVTDGNLDRTKISGSEFPVG